MPRSQRHDLHATFIKWPAGKANERVRTLLCHVRKSHVDFSAVAREKNSMFIPTDEALASSWPGLVTSSDLRVLQSA